jgi:hypothetical protein
MTRRLTSTIGSLVCKRLTSLVINLCGRYEFTKAPESINIAAIIQALAQAPVPQDLAL